MTLHLHECRPRLFVPSSQAPWDPWALQGPPTSCWTPETPRIWQTRRRRASYRRGRSYWRGFPQLNNWKYTVSMLLHPSNQLGWQQHETGSELCLQINVHEIQPLMSSAKVFIVMCSKTTRENWDLISSLSVEEVFFEMRPSSWSLRHSGKECWLLTLYSV